MPLNEIWQLQSKLTNYFYPQQKPISKVRNGATVPKKHDTTATAFHHAIDHPTMTVERIVALTRTYSLINPAATQHQIQALTAQPLTLATSIAGPDALAPIFTQGNRPTPTAPDQARTESTSRNCSASAAAAAVKAVRAATPC